MEQQIQGQISALNSQQLAPSLPGNQQSYLYSPYPPWIQTPSSFWQMPALVIAAPTPTPTPAPAIAPITDSASVVLAVPAVVANRSSSPIAEEEELVLKDTGLHSRSGRWFKGGILWRA
jgi:hypothetical protein